MGDILCLSDCDGWKTVLVITVFKWTESLFNNSDWANAKPTVSEVHPAYFGPGLLHGGAQQTWRPFTSVLMFQIHSGRKPLKIAASEWDTLILSLKYHHASWVLGVIHIPWRCSEQLCSSKNFWRLRLLLGNGILHRVTWSSQVHFIDQGASLQPTTQLFLLAEWVDYLP